MKVKMAVNPVTPAGTLLSVPGTLSQGDCVLAEGHWDAGVRE